MSSLSRLFGSLASQELKGITDESAKDPAFREVVVRSLGDIAISNCTVAANNIRTDNGNTLQSVDRAIVALVQYRDIVYPPMYLTDAQSTELTELKGQERGDRFMELTDEAIKHSEKRHECLVGAQKHVASTLRSCILAELNTEAEAELTERFGEAVTKAILGTK